jgi:hypothetical protein
MAVLRIGWNFVEFNDIMLEDFELHRGKRRTRDQMLLSAYDRQSILLQEWKFSQREIQGAILSANKVKYHRQSTLNKETSSLPFQVRRGLDLLSECAVTILEIWRKNNESSPDIMKSAIIRSQKCQLDDTNHKQIVSIDLEPALDQMRNPH